MRQARLSKIAYIPQGAMNSLNPVMRIGAQMVDAIKAHGSRRAARRRSRSAASHALESVDLEPRVFRMYPHELSGGMKQRVCIAIGILLTPQVIIADEPTSALDVVTQRQVMETIDRVQDQIGAAVILIGHDMGLMAQFVDRVAVMYAGRLVEVSDVREMFTDAAPSLCAGADPVSCPTWTTRACSRASPAWRRRCCACPGLRVPPALRPGAWRCCKTDPPRARRSCPDGRLVTCHLFEGGVSHGATCSNSATSSKTYTRRAASTRSRRSRWTTSR